METKKILTGSRAFFAGMEGFNPHDTDYAILVNKEDVNYLFKSYRADRVKHECHFFYVRNPKERLLPWIVKHAIPMTLCSFLVPEFCQQFGITVSDLEILRPLRDRMDRRHSYLVVIYDAYIENGSMALTDQQRQAAFEEYKKERS